MPDNTRQIDHQRTDRALGALQGCALGDALGMPSQTLSRADIVDHYGYVSDFLAPFEGHPVSHGLLAGAVTDDTEQTLILAHRILASPDVFDDQAWANDLLAWEAGIRQRGLHDILGPSTKLALQFLLAGVPASETGLRGTTNGAAMRISPVAIATPLFPLPRFLEQIRQTCRVTHDTAEAMSAATAVAAVISLGVDGATFRQAAPLAIDAAREMALQFDVQKVCPSVLNVPDAIMNALELAAQGIPLPEFADTIGNSVASVESIPAAFGIVRLADYKPWQAAVLAANAGDDTDTIGSIAAAMAASCTGAAQLPRDKVKHVMEANGLQLEKLVEGLLRIRQKRTEDSLGSTAAGDR